IEIDRKAGWVFISADDRRTNGKNPGSIEGGILSYKIKEGITSIRNVTPMNFADFHPHGISLLRLNDSTLFLFAINHQRSGHQVVERFEWRNDSLIHLESIEDKTIMTSPNDLVAVGERS